MESCKLILSTLLFVSLIGHYNVQASPISAINSKSMLGQLSESIPANEDIESMVQTQASSIKRLLGDTSIDQIEAISFSKQVVQGMNYFVKCKLIKSDQTTQFIHVKIFKPLRGEPMVAGYSSDHTQDSPISYFE